MVGNGDMLKKFASGSTKIKSLNMYDVLYVLEITKTLVNVSKLTHDNNIIVEFIADCFSVKDKQTWKALVRRTLKEGLY